MYSPEFNAALQNAVLSGNYDGVQIDFRMGCNSTDYTLPTETPSFCTGRSLNNGYEQLFLARGFTPEHPVPEIDAMAGTGAFALLGGAMMLAGERRRRKPA